MYIFVIKETVCAKFAGPQAQGVLDRSPGPSTFFCLLPAYPHSGSPAISVMVTSISVMAPVGRPCKSPKPLRGPSQIDLTKYTPWSNSKLKFNDNH